MEECEYHDSFTLLHALSHLMPQSKDTHKCIHMKKSFVPNRNIRSIFSIIISKEEDSSYY